MTHSSRPPEPGEMWQMLRALSEFRLPAGRSGADLVVSVTAGSDPGPRASFGEAPGALLVSRSGVFTKAPSGLGVDAQGLFELYAPLCHPASSCMGVAIGVSAPELIGSFVVAHLGQSLDGRIAPPSGKPEAITSAEDMTHNHRMRALFDVCLVGAGTVRHDDPALTVRHVQGNNPVRVVLDPERRLSAEYALFNDGLAPTLLLCRHERSRPGERLGAAEVVGVPAGCGPAAVVETLRERGLRRIFVEGGGVTVSRFLAAGCLHRLQIAVSPCIFGQGRPGIDLEQTVRLRPRVRRFDLADDVLFECCFDGS